VFRQSLILGFGGSQVLSRAMFLNHQTPSFSFDGELGFQVADSSSCQGKEHWGETKKITGPLAVMRRK
jgi:hypothetical protein